MPRSRCFAPIRSPAPAWDEELEFFSIKVDDGPLTQHLQRIQPGDTVLLRPKSTGTLVVDALTPAKRLFMISTGTGIAPFASLIRDPDTYEKFEQVVLTHTCRDHAELQYGVDLVDNLANDPLIGELVAGRVTLYSTTTREITPRMGRITRLIENGRFYHDLGDRAADPATDRVMICGSDAYDQGRQGAGRRPGFCRGFAQPPEHLCRRARLRRLILATAHCGAATAQFLSRLPAGIVSFQHLIPKYG